jgi:hypothetical protein
MLKARILFVLLLAVTLLAACANVSITGSGNVVTEEESISDFDKVDASHGFKVDVSQGDTFRVIIRADDNVMEHVDVSKSGDKLKIGLKPRRSYNLKDTTLEAEVTMPALVGLNLSSGSRVNITGFNSAADLDAELSSGSHLRGDIEAGDVNFDLSSGSGMALSGSAQDLKLNASSGGQIDLGDFSVMNADVEMSSGGAATVNVSGTLNVDASSGSDVTYVGNPTLGDIETSSGASVERE